MHRAGIPPWAEDVTTVGSSNFFYGRRSHVGRDCIVADNVIMITTPPRSAATSR